MTDLSDPVLLGHVIIAGITTIGTIICSSISGYVLIRLGRTDRTINKTHDLVNGQTEAMIEKVRAEAFAAGVKSAGGE